jgi:hypothetical protein
MRSSARSSLRCGLDYYIPINAAALVNRMRDSLPRHHARADDRIGIRKLALWQPHPQQACVNIVYEPYLKAQSTLTSSQHFYAFETSPPQRITPK